MEISKDTGKSFKLTFQDVACMWNIFLLEVYLKAHQFSVFYSLRQYCARRIRRIRKSLHFIQGTRYKVQPKKITQEMILKDAR